jgi:hypothetical protein
LANCAPASTSCLGVNEIIDLSVSKKKIIDLETHSRQMRFRVESWFTDRHEQTKSFGGHTRAPDLFVLAGDEHPATPTSCRSRRGTC